MQLKKLGYLIWFLFIISWGVCYLYNPNILDPATIKSFLSEFRGTAFLLYFIVTIVRGLFLIPSTPFVIAGGLLFPDQLFLVLCVSMLGVMNSATMLYYFSDALGFSNYFEENYYKELEYVKSKLTDTKAFLFVIFWAFLPIVPTDLICYIGGIIKMPFRYVFGGVFIGELILDIGYVYLGASINNIL